MKLHWKRALPLFIILCFLFGCKSSQHAKKPVSGVPVTIAEAQLQTMQVILRSVGSLVSKTEPLIRSQVQGVVQEIYVYEGEIVHKGQLLIRISKEKVKSELYQTESALLKAQAQLAASKDMYDSYSILMQKNNISKMKFEQAQMSYRSAEAELKSAEYQRNNAIYNFLQADIYSPLDGQILKIMASEGENVQVGDQLIQLISHEKLQARFPFSEDKLHYLHIGQMVFVQSVTHPEENLTAAVQAISPAINPINLGLDVTLEFQNNQGWRSGASVLGKLVATKPEKAVMIPEESVLLRPQGFVAFVINKNQAEERLLTTGQTMNGRIEVLKGIEAGEWVAVNGADYLGNGSLVQVTGKVQ